MPPCWGGYRHVAVNQVCQGAPLGLSGLEVATFDNSGLCCLHPLARIGELGECGREWGCALASHLDAIDLLAVLARTLDDGCHAHVSLG